MANIKLKTIKEIKKLKFENQVKYIDQNTDKLEAEYGQDYLRYLCRIIEPIVYDIEPEKQAILKQYDFISPNLINEVWEYNHAHISNYLYKAAKGIVIKKTTEMSEETELACSTIRKHYQSFDKVDKWQSMKKQRKIMRGTLLNTLFFEATRNTNMQAASLFLQHTQEKELKIKSEVTNNNTTNYIQVNNLKVTADQMDSLPQSAITEIESILNKELKLLENGSSR